MRRIGRLGAACIAALMLSCSSGPEKAVLGQWQEIDGMETWDFRKDGKLLIKAEGFFEMDARYTFVEKERMKVETERLTDTVKVAFQGGELVLTFGDGQVTRYRKLK